MQTVFNQSIRFLVASDNHLGANENIGLKSTRYQDAFDAFEEVLQIAQEQKVDFLILGGDLFHEKHPTEHCLLKCVDILQRYVFGDNFSDIQMEMNSLNYRPNFSSSNFNVQLPIFIINGNHDDIVTEREESVSILDILHESKYLNYIGKITNQSFVSIKPIVLVKNDLRIALYGLGYMKDYQLYKLINEGKLVLELLEQQNFNILIIHQNRNKGTHFSDEQNFIDPIYFKKYGINLIIWGHEHEAKYTLERCEHYQIFSAGSTVATSLIEQEALIKQAGLFVLTKNEMKFESIKLENSYRPMIFKQIELSELINNVQPNSELTQQELAEKLLYESVETELTNYFQNSKYRKKLPLLRFKVEYSGFELMKMRFLETKFKDKVSNPDKIFQFWEKKNNFIKQLQKRKDQINHLNIHFDDIMQNKMEYLTQNNQMMSEFSIILQNKLKTKQFALIQSEDFINVFDNYLACSQKEKTNLFQDLQKNALKTFQRNSIACYDQKITQSIKKFKDHQLNLIMYIKTAMQQNFTQGKSEFIVLDDYNDDYSEQIKILLAKYENQYKNDNQINRNSIQQLKNDSKNKNHFNIKQDQIEVISIESDSLQIKQTQTQASIFDGDDDNQIEYSKTNKKGGKKRKPIKKEEEFISQKQQIKLPPYKGFF